VRTVLVCVRTSLAAQTITTCAARLGAAAAVRTAVSEAEVMTRLAERPADVVLADTAVTRPDSVGFTRRVLARAPYATIVFFGPEDPRVAAATVAAGARGVIRGGDQDLVSAVAKALLLLFIPANAPVAGSPPPPRPGTSRGPVGRGTPGAAEPPLVPGGFGAGVPGAGAGGPTGGRQAGVPRASGEPIGGGGAAGAGPGAGIPAGSGLPGGSGAGVPAGSGYSGGPRHPGGVVPPGGARSPGGAAGAGPEQTPDTAAPAIVPAQRGDLGEGLPGGQPGRAGAPGQRRVALTERELQVLRGMADGKSNAEIGRELFVSEDTVKTHARRLFRKLGARDRAHAVAAGFRAGLVL
jgi:DNA-binding NarL/FixJ family response regulator